jgi:hypothetical protein
MVGVYRFTEPFVRCCWQHLCDNTLSLGHPPRHVGTKMMPEGGYMQMAIPDRHTDRHKD